MLHSLWIALAEKDCVGQILNGLFTPDPDAAVVFLHVHRHFKLPSPILRHARSDQCNERERRGDKRNGMEITSIGVPPETA